MQLYKQFDPETIAKIKSSATVALVGFLVAVLPMIQEDIMMMFQDKPYVVAALTAFGGWAFNTLKKYYQGIKPEDQQ